MLDLCDPDCEWTGLEPFNHILQSISGFKAVRAAYMSALVDNMGDWYA